MIKYTSDLLEKQDLAISCIQGTQLKQRHNKIWKLKNRRWDTRQKETVVDVWSDVTGFETKKKNIMSTMYSFILLKLKKNKNNRVRRYYYYECICT